MYEEIIEKTTSEALEFFKKLDSVESVSDIEKIYDDVESELTNSICKYIFFMKKAMQNDYYFDIIRERFNQKVDDIFDSVRNMDKLDS